MRFALSIAGSDPTGGAGLQADLRVFSAFGVHGLGVPSALTSQNTEGVDLIMPVERKFLERQLNFLLKDIKPHSLKTGMLYTAYAVEVTAYMVKKYSLSNLVIDPVTVSSSGKSLIEEGMLNVMKKRLFPLSTIITPNIYEAGLLTGIKIESEVEMEGAARAVKKMGSKVVIITGGEIEDMTIDLYYDGSDFYRLRGKKISGDYHGTGCAFSAGITAMLALRHTPISSARRAKEFLQSAIKKAYEGGRGMRLLNIKGVI